MFYFGIGFGEVSAQVGLVKDLLVILAALSLILKFHINGTLTIILAFVAFWLFIILGVIIKKSGMAAYGQMIQNSINPQILEISEILKEVQEIKKRLNETKQ